MAYKFGAFDRQENEIATFDTEDEAWDYVEAHPEQDLCAGFSHSTPYVASNREPGA